MEIKKKTHIKTNEMPLKWYKSKAQIFNKKENAKLCL